MKKNALTFVDKEQFIDTLMHYLKNTLEEVHCLMKEAETAKTHEKKHEIYLRAGRFVEEMTPLAPLFIAIVPESESDYMTRTFDDLLGLLDQDLDCPCNDKAH